MIKNNEYSFEKFCDKYEVPENLYDVLRLIKSKLGIKGQPRVVILIDEFISSAKEEKDRVSLLSTLCSFLDQQYSQEDFLSLDFMISSLESGPIQKFQTNSSRSIKQISLPCLKNASLLFKGIKETEISKKVLGYLIYLCGGHPRSLEHLSSNIEHQKSINQKFVPNEAIEWVMGELIEKYKKFDVTPEIVKAVLKRKPIKIYTPLWKDEGSDETLGYNIDQLVGSGYYTNDISNNDPEYKIVPEMSLITLRCYVKMRTAQNKSGSGVFQQIGKLETWEKHLKEVLLASSESVFEGKNNDRFQFNWEIMMLSLFEGEVMTLKDFYGCDCHQVLNFSAKRTKKNKTDSSWETLVGF